MKDETTVGTSLSGWIFWPHFHIGFFYKKKYFFSLIEVFSLQRMLLIELIWWTVMSLLKKKLPPKLENKSPPTNPNEKSVGRIQKWGWSRIYDVPQCFNTWYCMVPVITGTYWTSHFYNTVWIFETVPVRMLNS